MTPMPVTEQDKVQMWEELVSATRPTIRTDCPQPNITTGEYAEYEKVTVRMAHDRLWAGVENGIYEYQKGVLIDGHKATIFWGKQKKSLPPKE